MVAIQTKVFLLPTPLYPFCHTPAGSLSAFEPLAHLAMCCMPGTPTAKLGLFSPWTMPACGCAVFCTCFFLDMLCVSCF